MHPRVRSKGLVFDAMLFDLVCVHLVRVVYPTTFLSGGWRARLNGGIMHQVVFLYTRIYTLCLITGECRYGAR